VDSVQEVAGAGLDWSIPREVGSLGQGLGREDLWTPSPGPPEDISRNEHSDVW
jgi:hypothetical protein